MYHLAHSDFVLFFDLLTGNTGTLDTLDKISLAEQVDNDKRKDNKKSASMHNRLSEQVSARTCFLDEFIKRLRNFSEVSKCLNVKVVCIEECRIEVICPCPREREEEDSDHHRDGYRENDLQARRERRGRTVSS